MFEDVSGLPDQVELEREVLRFWRDAQVFERLRARNVGGPRFSFLDGPITANNPMGVHHAWGRTLKDLFQRYHAMCGHELRYQNGFDCQGLWVEVEVERELGFTSKRDIERFGVVEFIERCKERVERFSRIITEESIRLGCWMDWERSYSTHSDASNYAIWGFLKKCHERSLVYHGADVMPWCPRCATGISQQEMAEGYKPTVHASVVVALPLVGRPAEALLVWTTTPWTLTANVACAVHPDVTYVRARQGSRICYVAAARSSEVLNPFGPWQAEGELPGSELVGLQYEGPFDDLPQQDGASILHQIIPWRGVSDAEGTGIVHIAPGCGKDDYDLGQQHGLPAISPVDEEGRFVAGAGPFEGMRAGDAAEAIVAALRERKTLYRVDDHSHAYPHCWRCGSELLFRLVDEWYIAMEPWRQEIVGLAEATTWLPEYGRELELDWLRNMRDWMISKKRYWGLALPIWRCECGWFDVVGSREELQRRAVAGWSEFEGHSPHRPWLDAVKVRCEQCGGAADRIPEVGNPWLDAGIVPYSTMGYFDDRATWERWFPADLVVECLAGQFRNWFYALLAMSTMLTGRVPARRIIGHGVVVDENGEEMHKSKGNAIWFSQAADAMGADSVRWICASQPLTQPLRFGLGRAEEVRAWLRTLWNVYSFLATYANVDGWPGSTPPRVIGSVEDARAAAPLDRWLRARLSAGVTEVTEAIESGNPPRATTALHALLDDLSNWWVRRSRRRFWKNESDGDKAAAYHTLHSALITLCQLLAPFMPFTAEALYQRLRRPFDDALPESVHLCPWPSPEPRDDEEEILAECDQAREIIRLGRAARERAGIRVRQPLAGVLVCAPAGDPALRHFRKDVLEELNVKRVDIVAWRDAGDMVWAEGSRISVGLDTTLTKSLLLEGVARDLVRQIQTLRRQAGLKVTDRIAVCADAEDAAIAEALEVHAAFVERETLARIAPSRPPSKAAAAALCVRVGGHRVELAIWRESATCDGQDWVG